MADSLVPETRVLAVASQVRLLRFYTVESFILTAVAGRLWVGDQFTTCGVTPGNDVPANNMRQPCGKQHGDIRHAVHGMRGGRIEHGALQ